MVLKLLAALPGAALAALCAGAALSLPIGPDDAARNAAAGMIALGLWTLLSAWALAQHRACTAWFGVIAVTACAWGVLASA